MFKYLDLSVAIIFISYYFYLEIVFGGLAFSKFFLVIGVILIIYHFVKDKLKEYGNFYKCFNIFICSFLAFFILMEVILVFYPKSNIEDDCDYLIILGAAVKKTTPSLTLQGRLDSALNYLEKSKDDCYIVVSGGKGKGEDISEAEAMKLYLKTNSVDEDKIIVEDKSTSTHENFKFSKEKIEKHSGENIEKLNIKAVTTDFHSFRSSLIAKRNNYKGTTYYTSKSLKQFIPVYYTREFFATIKTIILDK